MVEPNVLKVEVGESPLKAIRNLLGMSQPEFAVWLGIGTSTVSRWERGQGTPMFSFAQFKLLLAELESKGITLAQLPDDLSVKTEE